MSTKSGDWLESPQQVGNKPATDARPTPDRRATDAGRAAAAPPSSTELKGPPPPAASGPPRRLPPPEWVKALGVLKTLTEVFSDVDDFRLEVVTFPPPHLPGGVDPNSDESVAPRCRRRRCGSAKR